MKILISPAKTLDLTTKPTVKLHSEPLFGQQASVLMQRVNKLSTKKLQALMQISDKLVTQVQQYHQNWQFPHKAEHTKAAAYLFKGDVYLGLQAYQWQQQQAEFAQQNLRILSGLYGILRPFDYIMPYRLEMGRTIGKTPLIKYWKKVVKQQLVKDLKPSETIVNLASDEYFSVVDTQGISDRIVQVKFKDYSNGNYKVISFFAKKARGLMANWLITNRVTNIDDIVHFDIDGYYFQPSASEGNTLTFYRDAVAKSA